MVLKGFILLVFFGFFLSGGFAQDIHFSQQELSPLNMNPALNGLFPEEFRLHANHRNQWRSVTVPYTTFSTSFDAGIRQLFTNSGFAGVGLVLNNDKAGDGDFGTNQLKLGLAWHQIMNSDSTCILSVGINGAWNQHSVNYSAFYFNSQYNGFYYDPTLPALETFPDDQMSYIDFSLGLHAYYLLKKKIPLTAGVAFHHLNKPEQSFFGDALNELDRKFDFHAEAVLRLNDNTDLLPSVVIYKQGKLVEVNTGALFRLYTNQVSFRAIYLGGWFRPGDAGIASFGFDYQNLRVGISYDLNLSSLKVASHGRGGLELGVRYVFNIYKLPVIPDKHICPPYI